MKESKHLDMILLQLRALTGAEQRKVFFMLGLSNQPKQEKPDRILRRDEVARRFAVNPRTVDKWNRDGLLKKVTLPGKQRSQGFRESDIEQLISHSDAAPISQRAA